MDDLLARALRVQDALTRKDYEAAKAEIEELVLVLEDAMDAADKTIALTRGK